MKKSLIAIVLLSTLILSCHSAENGPGNVDATIRDFFLVSVDNDMGRDKILYAVDSGTGAEAPIALDCRSNNKVFSFSPDRKTAAYMNMNENLVLWDLSSGKRRIVANGYLDHSSPQWSKDGKTILFEAEKNRRKGIVDDRNVFANAIDLSTMAITPMLKNEWWGSGYREALSYTKSGAILFVPRYHAPIESSQLENPERTVYAYSRSEKTVMKFAESDQGIHIFRVSPSQESIAFYGSGNEKGILSWENLSDHSKGIAARGSIQDFFWSPDSQYLVAWDEEKVLLIRPGSSAEPIRYQMQGARDANPVCGAAWQDGGKNIAVAFRDGEIHVLSLEGQLIRKVTSKNKLHALYGWFTTPDKVPYAHVAWNSVGTAKVKTAEELGKRLVDAIKDRDENAFVSLLASYEESMPSEEIKKIREGFKDRPEEFKKIEHHFKTQHEFYVLSEVGDFQAACDLFAGKIGKFKSIRVGQQGEDSEIMVTTSDGKSALSIKLERVKEFGDYQHLVRLGSDQDSKPL